MGNIGMLGAEYGIPGPLVAAESIWGIAILIIYDQLIAFNFYLFIFLNLFPSKLMKLKAF